MTRRELIKVLNLNEEELTCAFTTASKVKNNIKEKLSTFRSNSDIVQDWTLEELQSVLDFYPKKITLIQRVYLKENFIDHGNKPIIKKPKDDFIEGQKEFLEKKSNFIKCCNTCEYLIGRLVPNKGSRIAPYCSFYNRFMARVGANIFKDHCETYKYKKPPYRLWYKSSKPVNIGSDGEIDETVNGTSREDFAEE